MNNNIKSKQKRKVIKFNRFLSYRKLLKIKEFQIKGHIICGIAFIITNQKMPKQIQFVSKKSIKNFTKNVNILFAHLESKL